MDIEFKGNSAFLSKELTIYDRLALDFSKILNLNNVRHVFVSGYVSLLFGRSRTSEDIDLIIEPLSIERFRELWTSIQGGGFYCHNTKDPSAAYNEYLRNDVAIRFSEDGWVIPNIEFKLACTELHRRVLEDNITVHVPGGTLVISPLEIQIAFKLFLGSDKDVEDARYLFELFREELDLKTLGDELANMEIPIAAARESLGWE